MLAVLSPKHRSPAMCTSLHITFVQLLQPPPVLLCLAKYIFALLNHCTQIGHGLHHFASVLHLSLHCVSHCFSLPSIHCLNSCTCVMFLIAVLLVDMVQATWILISVWMVLGYLYFCFMHILFLRWLHHSVMEFNSHEITVYLCVCLFFCVLDTHEWSFVCLINCSIVCLFVCLFVCFVCLFAMELDCMDTHACAIF